MPERETIAEMLACGMQQLSKCGNIAHIEARALLRHRLQMSDAELLTRGEQPIAETAARDFAADIARRLSGEPMAYIVGHREFMGLNFITTPAALIPRPETEELTEAAIWHLPPDTRRQVLDIGTGCGAIGLSIALKRLRCEVKLAEYDNNALALARQNAATLGARAAFCRSDWYAGISGRFHLIVSNPPYVQENREELKALRYEPILALCGGADGLRALAAVIVGAPQHLHAGGVLIVEHGYDQQKETRRLFAEAGFCGIRCLRDIGGQPRITLGVRGG